MPASMTTWRPPRSRTCRTRATSQPDRATSARPGSMARRAGRRSSGTAARRSGSSRAKRSGAGHRLVRAGRTGNPPPTSSVSNVVEVAAAAGRRPRGRAGPRRARRRPRAAASRRGGGRRVAGSRRRRASPATRRGRSPRSRSCRTWTPHRPTASPAIVSGRDLGVEPDEHVERRPSAPPQAGPSGHRGQDLGLVRRTRGRPTAAAAPAAVDRIAARRSASVLPTPSSEIRSSGTPARRATAHSPRETTLAPKPREVTSATIGRHVVGLDRVLPDPRVGERRPDGRRCAVQLGEVGHIGGRAVAASDLPRADAIASGTVGAMASSVADDKPDGRADKAQDDRPDDRGDDRVGRQERRRKVADGQVEAGGAGR